MSEVYYAGDAASQDLYVCCYPHGVRFSTEGSPELNRREVKQLIAMLVRWHADTEPGEGRYPS